ncbi:MAG: glycosyltransferase [Candidatus Latescibacteria bacterium]|nr:glycosyltransferase [Candidatus Latescibacterota bacterium]
MSAPDSICASVVIATYNRRDMLAQCLGALSEQAFDGGYEVVVVDDGSSDGTEAMVAGLVPGYPVPLVYFRQQNRGVAVARNAGLAGACGAVIAFLDDDHVATKTWLQDICRALEDPGVGGVSGRGRAVAGPALISRYLCFHRAHEAPKIEGGEVLYLVTGNSAFRREAVERAGPFDERFASFFKGVAPGGEDTEFSMRLRQAGYRLAYVPSAITDHHQKTSFRTVMKERFNFGVNRVLWYRVEGRRLSLSAVTGHILWMAISLVKWPIHAWRYRRKGLSLVESAAFPAIDKASEIVYHAGSLYGMLRIKTFVP